MIGKCITQLLKINLTINKHFYQMDHEGDIYGYLQSGLHGLVSLHHMFSLWEPFPEEHTRNEKEIIDIIQLAYQTFDYYFLKTYFKRNYQTNQTLLLTIGYSFTLFNRILSLKELTQLEKTWCCTHMVDRITRPEEKDKINWFFKRLTTQTDYHHSENRSIYEHNERQINDYIPNLEIILLKLNIYTKHLNQYVKSRRNFCLHYDKLNTYFSQRTIKNQMFYLMIVKQLIDYPQFYSIYSFQKKQKGKSKNFVF